MERNSLTLPVAAWSAAVVKRFSIADPSTTDESQYYAPYNMLLFECFGLAEGFSIAPVAHPVGERDSIDFSVEYIVEIDAKPVFFVEVKAPANLRKLSKRDEADQQMRKRFRQLMDDCPIPVLRGLSAFGTKVSFYEVDVRTGVILPPGIERDLSRVNDVAPVDRWLSNDVLEKDTIARVKSVVQTIKGECASLNGSQ